MEGDCWNQCEGISPLSYLPKGQPIAYLPKLNLVTPVREGPEPQILLVMHFFTVKIGIGWKIAVKFGLSTRSIEALI